MTSSSQPLPSLLQGAGLEGWTSGCLRHWTRSDQEIVGDDGCKKVAPEMAGGRIETGDPLWKNYEFTARIRPIAGVMAQLHYRICEKGRCWYTFDLSVEGSQASISKVDLRAGGPGRSILHAVPFQAVCAREYEVRVVAEYSSLTAFVDGRQINQATDSGKPWLAGQVGFGIWQCKAAFIAPRIRMLD